MKELRRLSITLMTMALAGAGWAGAQQKQAKNTASPPPTSTDRRANATAGPLTADGPVKGSGITNFIPLWTSSSTIGNSIMSQSTSSNVNLSGSLTLSDSINNALTLQGNLTDSSGDQGANVIGGFGGANGLQGNSVGSGVLGATIAGGGGAFLFGGSVVSVPNTVTADWGTVSGGQNNTAGSFAVVTGGSSNQATGPHSFVGGGGSDIASGLNATVGGGASNTASGRQAFVGGGGSDIASGLNATVGGGASNTASGTQAIVGGGAINLASGLSSTVPGGFGNVAAGTDSFAAGTSAQANHDGSFVWGDSANRSGILSDTGANQFVAAASGGFTSYTNPDLTSGATLAAGSGSWSSLSDRNVKANFSAVDGPSLLAKIATLPISTWNYQAQSASIRHMGPMAQDFRAAFGLGEDDKHISTVDSEGVALAAIQALYQLSQEKGGKIEELAREVNELRTELARLARKP